MHDGPLTMTPDLIAVLATVTEQLEEQIDALDRHGARYAQRLVQDANRPKCWRQGPPALHPFMRKLVRELVADELAVRRSGSLAR